MTAAAMGFLLAVSLVSAVAAWLADRGLRGLGVASRFVWLAALGSPLVLLAAALASPVRGGRGSALEGMLPTVVELPPLVVGSAEGGDTTVGTMALALWVVSGLLFAAILLRARVLLARAAREWPERRVAGHAVLVSPEIGPAVAGIMRPRIVLPVWALELPATDLAMVLAHEDEHLSAGDPRLLGAAIGLIAVMAWNPVAWWMLARLRSAVEIDCDRRVLRRHPEVGAYGRSLLTVASRVPRNRLALAAFAESPHTLERRLIAMTTRITTRTRTVGAGLLTAAALVAVQACGVDGPQDRGLLGPDEPVTSEVPEALASEPTFTPFTVPPEITNRKEVIAAMEAAYPPLLRDAGIEGRVRVYFLIAASGTVADVRLDQSSGHEALDRAALSVARVYRFLPARMGDEPVPVWVSFPISFRSQ